MRTSLKLISVQLFTYTVLTLPSCEKDNSILAPSFGEDQTCQLDISKGPVYIKHFDVYSTNGTIKLFWTTDSLSESLYPRIKSKSSIPKTIRVYISQSGPDADFYLIYQTDTIGDDFTVLRNLDNNLNYYFRLATFATDDSLLGISKPLMTSPGWEKDIFYSENIREVESPLYIKNLSWSRDGNKLALIKADGGLYPNIYILDMGSFMMRQLSHYSGDDYRLMGLDYSINDKYVAYSYTKSSTYFEIDYRIWMVNVSDNTARAITSGKVDADPVWMSAGLLLFCKGTYNPPNIPQLYVVNLEDKKETALTTDQSIYKYTPDVYSKNSMIAYSGEVGHRRFLYLSDIAGHDQQPLTENAYWQDLHPYWSSNGEDVYFTSDRSGHYEIWSININSGRYNQVTHGLERGINRFYGRISPDNKYIALLEQEGEQNYTLKILKNYHGFVLL